MTERFPDHEEDGSGKPPRVRWERARPGHAHAVGVGAMGLDAMRKLGKQLAEKRKAREKDSS